MVNKKYFSKFKQLCSAFLLSIILFTACKKMDTTSTEEQTKPQGTEQFFIKNTTTDPLVSRVAQRIREINASDKNYVQDIITKYGYAYWNKWLTYENGNSHYNRTENTGGDTTVIIPLVQNIDTTVNSYLEATINDSITIEFHNKSEYATVPFSTTSALCNDAEKVALLYMHLSNAVFNTTQFKILDKRLFHQSGNYADTASLTRFVKIETAQNGNRTELLAVNLCYNVTVWTIGANWHCTNSGSCTSGTCDGCHLCVDYYVTQSTQLNCFTEYIETGGGTGGGSGGGGGGGSWTPTSYSTNAVYLSNLLQLSVLKKDWLNTHPSEAQVIYDFLEESRNLDPDEDPFPIGYTPVQATNVAKAAIEIGYNYSLHTYTEAAYNAIKQYFPAITGTTAQQADIFWSNFSFHAAISKEMYPGIPDFQHYLYSLNKLYDCNLSQSATGTTTANLNTNYLQTINGQGLNASFVNQSPIISTTDLTPVEFKRKEITNPQGKKITIVWYKDNVTNKITFGDRGQMRDILGLPKGDPKIAHHIIPVGVCIGTASATPSFSNSHPAIQLLGSKGDFHMNQPENGIPNNNAGSHNTYDGKVRLRLDNLWLTYQQTGNYTNLKNGVFALMAQIRTLLSNPATHPNNINF